MDTSLLGERINQIAVESGARDIAVALYDYETDESFSHHGETPFHAASTIKVPILLTVFGAIDEGRYTSETKVHVRNRFFSLVGRTIDAPGGEIFHVSSARDANAKVHAARGRMLTIGELAYHMIVTSSNLATNLLLDVIGLGHAKEMLRQHGLNGIELYRGVEDDRAHDAGIDNTVTANGLLEVFRAINERRGISNASSETMLDILHRQEFRSGIPAGIPANTKVAHKTGEISTVAHDTGLIFPEDRKPYALVILTEWEPDKGERQTTLATISKWIYETVAQNGVDHE